MNVRSAQLVVSEFTTNSPTGAVNADSLPTGTLYVNGTANAAAVTVTNQATGIYKASVTIPTLAVGDIVSLVVNATVGGITNNNKSWEASNAADIAALILTTALTEAYAADGAAPTLAQFQFMLWAFLSECSISGVTKTSNKIDGSTTAMTHTLDSATQPTAIDRTT